MSSWIARLRVFFGGLAPRERILVLAAGGLLCTALLWALVVSPVLSLIEQGGQRRETADQELMAMKRLAREYDAAQRRLSDVEQRIRAGTRGNLRTTLETLAREASVKVESMEPQASPANDAYRETKVEVGLKNVDLAQTVQYLHAIEQATQVMSIKSLRIRTRADQELLDVSFTVSSFEPL